MMPETPLAAARARFDAVLLDLDGTLVDSLPDLLAALNPTLQAEGLRPVAASEIRTMFGDGATKLVERALRATGGYPGRAAFLVPAYLARYQSNVAAETVPFPGVPETLHLLNEAGFAVAVVTNKPARAAGIVLDALGLSRFVQTVIGGDTAGRLKPDPAPLHEALRRLGIPAARAVMVGDMHHDVEAARATGTAAVLATYGYAQRPPEAVGADRLIATFADLPEALTLLSEHVGAFTGAWSPSPGLLFPAR